MSRAAYQAKRELASAVTQLVQAFGARRELVCHAAQLWEELVQSELATPIRDDERYAFLIEEMLPRVAEADDVEGKALRLVSALIPAASSERRARGQ